MSLERDGCEDLCDPPNNLHVRWCRNLPLAEHPAGCVCLNHALAARTAEALDVACAAVCDGCCAGKELISNRYHRKEDTGLYVCDSLPLRSAWVAKGWAK